MNITTPYKPSHDSPFFDLTVQAEHIFSYIHGRFSNPYFSSQKNK